MDFLVIGKSGLLGSQIVEMANSHANSVSGTVYSRNIDGVRRLDKCDASRVEEIVDDVRPDVVFDVAAFHAVDDCETQRTQAFDVNARGTYNVAQAADGVGAHYVFVSTDYVFPGTPADAPYDEESPVKPCNYYAQTKYAGEQAAKVADEWTVLRSSVIYGLASDNFVTWVLSELREGNEIGIVDDQTSTPTYAPDLARACVDVAEGNLTGLYHATGPESLSRYEFTRRLANVYGYDPDLVAPVTTEELGQKAARPTDGSLDSTKLYDAISYEFRPPTDAFEAIKSETDSEIT